MADNQEHAAENRANHLDYLMERILSGKVEDIDSLELGDLINVQEVQQIMDEFYKLTGVGIGILDMKGRVLVGTGWQDICVNFHRKNPQSLRNCHDSDLLLSTGVEPGAFKLYRCKNHMYDIATPITVGNRHMGNVFLGQFFFEDEPPDTEFFRNQAEEFGFDEQAYLAALDRTPRWSREKVNNVMTFYSRLTQLISSMSYNMLQLAQSMVAQRQIENRFQIIYENAPDAYLIIEIDKGVISDCNHAAEAMLHGRREQIIGKTPDEVSPLRQPDGRLSSDAAAEKIAESLRDGKNRFEWVHRRLDGEDFWAEVTLSTIFMSGRQVLLVAWRDINDRIKLENTIRKRNEEMKRSNAELNDIVHIIAHDLKEPVRSIHSFSDFLLEDYRDRLDENGFSHINVVMQSAIRMESLLDDLFTYSRLGRSELVWAPADLGQVVAKTVTGMSAMLEERNARVTVAGNLPIVVCDQVRLGEVFHNLIENAVKYNDSEEKLIEVGQFQGGGAENKIPVFYVRDNGIGIRDKHLGKVFKIFKRLHGRNKYGGGTGAGLTIVRKIVESHGGRVWVESEFGKGSTFFFTLGSGS